jgi:threonine dehydrogenase-like Zn-dependent dehydrogenase
VAVDSFVACGKCHYCRSGAVLHCTDRTMSSDAWAEYVVVHEGAVYQIPDSMSLETAALAEPLAAGLQAIDEAGMRSGSVALFLGAGPIGLGILALARVSGAAVTIVSEPSEYRRKLAVELGADVVVNPLEESLTEIVRGVSDGLGADVAFDAVTRAATVQQGIDAVRLGGLVLVVGNAPPDDELATRPAELHRSGKMIKGTTKRAFNFDRTLRWLAKLDFGPLITHQLPLEEINQALELSRDGRAGKILLIP